MGTKGRRPRFGSDCGEAIRVHGIAGLAFGTLAGGFDPIPTFDDVCLQADGARPAMEFQEQTTGVAENGAEFIPAPEGGGGGATILTDGL